MRSVYLVVALVSTGIVACDGDENGGGGDDGGGRGGGGNCMLSDLCEQLTPTEVDAACTSTATMSTPLSEPGPVADARLCSYERPDGRPVFHALLDCFHDGAGPAGAAFEEESLDTSGDGTQESVAGVGDQAFYRYSVLTDQGELWVLQGDLIATLLDFEPDSAEAARDCMITLAPDVLAAN